MATTPVASEAEAKGGAKKRSGIPLPRSASVPRPLQPPEMRRIAEDGGDSGLSSECTTPTNGSPPPRQPKEPAQATAQATALPRRRMVDIIAASKARLQEAERLSNNRTARLLHSRSSTESPRSLDSTRSRQVFSPLRPQRNVQSPSLDSGDEGSLRIERGTYSYMFQDIVSIKTMLLKLKRVLQESGENGLTRTDTLNPFDSTLKNGLFYNLNDGNLTTDAGTTPNEARDAAIADELCDLRRQVVFLQGQVDDKDRTIQSLQSQLTKYQNAEKNGLPVFNGRSDEPQEMSNAATQTDKLRPLSTGSSILQGLPQDNGMGPLVSWNESWSSNSSSTTTATSSHPAQQQRAGQQEQPSSSSCASSNSSLNKLASRRSSSSDSPQSQQPRPSSLRSPSQLRLPNGCATALPSTPPDSPKIRAARTKSVDGEQQLQLRSSIPTPRRLTAPTLIPRAARAVSATGRAHNS